MISIIVAMNHKSVIGNKGKIPWYIPSELKHFKEVTEGHIVIFGRKTWESLPKKYLPNRTNVVISNSMDDSEIPEVVVRGDIYSALTYCNIVNPGKHIFICGGSKLYRQCLPFVDRVYLSIIHNEEGGDTLFPCQLDDLMYNKEFVITREESFDDDWDFYLLERASTLPTLL